MIRKTKATARKGEAIKNTAAPVKGKPSGVDEEFWIRCWDRKRGLSARISDLAEIGCTIDEISAALDMSPEFLSSRYGHELRRGLARLRARLRRLLLESAESGKVPAQVWLGHLLLGGMEEQRQAEATARPGKVLEDMTTSEMLEEFVKGAARRGRRGAG
jgi:signal transduction histidine kinase